MIPGDFKPPSRPSRKKLALFAALGGVSLASFAGVALVTVYVISAWLGRPVIFGYNEGPDQPIAFPHTVHAGTAALLDADGSPRRDEQGGQLQGMGIACEFCHRNVAKGGPATIPAVGLCMTCHKAVGDGMAEIETLRAHYDEGRSIDWVRVHRLPDHVQFVHEAHVRRFSGTKLVVPDDAGRQGEIRLVDARKIDSDARVGDSMEVAVADVCVICHGDVAGMEKVRQERSLKMGDCVDCHRDNSAPTDCSTCHY